MLSAHLLPLRVCLDPLKQVLRGMLALWFHGELSVLCTTPLFACTLWCPWPMLVTRSSSKTRPLPAPCLLTPLLPTAAWRLLAGATHSTAVQGRITARQVVDKLDYSTPVIASPPLAVNPADLIVCSCRVSVWKHHMPHISP
jgi:hypothetical protein